MPDQLSLEEATAKRDAILAQLETAQAGAELKRIETAMSAVTESWGDIVDRQEWRYDDPTFYATGRWDAAATSRDDRAEGQDRFLFENEQDLHVIRGTGRLLVAEVEYATGIVEALTNYTVGVGSDVEVQPRDESAASPELVSAAQATIDVFAETNSWFGDRDREFFWRAVRDGETLLHVFQQDEAILARFIEPEHLTEPLNPMQLEDFYGVDLPSSWRFGVHTLTRDLETAIGYHIVRDTVGSDWDYLPAAEVQHYKRNVDRVVKRGVSDFHAVSKVLRGAEKLLGNTTEGAAIQAAIAFIREHVPGTTQSGVQGFITGKAYDTYTQSTPNNSSRTRNLQKYSTGTILDVPSGMQYKPGPMGSERAPAFIEVIQAALRAAFARWNMPEFMTGDASNANFASTLVAEAPFVKSRQAEQHRLSMQHSQIFWRVLRLAYDQGRFRQWVSSFAEMRARLELKIEPPEVATRDELALSQQQQIDVLTGTLSKRTAMMQRGRDPDEEFAAMAEEPATQAEPPQGPPGQMMLPFDSEIPESQRRELAAHLLWTDRKGNRYP